MDPKDYIESGILELFVLDLLNEPERAEVVDMALEFAEIRKEIKKIELRLFDYFTTISVKPSAVLKGEMDNLINKIVKEQDLGKLGLIDENSAYTNWLNFIRDHFPLAFETDNFSEVLRHQDGITQVLVVSSIDIDQEIHHRVHESFLILKGKCKCTIGEEEFYLNEGGYARVPLNTSHNVEVVNSPVIAILQRLPV